MSLANDLYRVSQGSSVSEATMIMHIGLSPVLAPPCIKKPPHCSAVLVLPLHVDDTIDNLSEGFLQPCHCSLTLSLADSVVCRG